MALIRNIDGELGTMTAGVDRAVQLTAEAGHAAGQIAARTAASGFTGIAQRMAQIHGAIGQLQGMVAHVGRLVNEARRPVSQAPDQMSPEDTIKVLGPVREQITRIHGALGAVIAKVGEIQQQTAAALQGGQPGPMLGRLDAIRQVLLAVVQHANAAKQHVETALAEAQQVGAEGN